MKNPAAASPGNNFTRFIPSPFSLAIGLSFLTFVLAFLLARNESGNTYNFIQLGEFYYKGFWELLDFAMQMMLILVLGYVLALTKPVSRLIMGLVRHCTSTSKAAVIIAATTMLVSIFNWGFGLIFGAIMARKTGDHCKEAGIKLNYPLVGAAGYSGLMVWHGGLSGSAPLKVAEKGHFLEHVTGVIPVSETIFSAMNITTTLAAVMVVCLLLFLLGRRATPGSFPEGVGKESNPANSSLDGGPASASSRWLAAVFALVILFIPFYNLLINKDIGFLSLNFINALLFALGLLLHGSLSGFSEAVSESVSSASGIMIQFPIYAGIMGLMKYSGLTSVFTDFFVGISTSTTYPLFTFVSAGIVNIFVPSGGGQWAVQGLVIAEASLSLGVSLPKSIMAMAYGDQLTNMLQPFWALPLLGITRIRAQELLPYTFLMMIAGGIVFALGLLVF